MASWQARVAAYMVRRRVKPALGDMRDLARVRAAFATPLPVPRGARFTDATLGGVRGEWIEAARPGPANRSADVTVLYLHGGGFVGCSPRTHRPLTAALARHGLRLFVPDYRLAPEHPFPAALDDVGAVWAALQQDAAAAEVRGERPVRLGIAGDSAGGNLALALMLALRDAGARLPAAAALFSPATDLTGGSASLRLHSERDAMFRGEALERLAEAYLAGADAAQPRASPLLGDLAGLPPLLVHVGADEVLRDDSLRLVEKARAAGVVVALEVFETVPHVWQLLGWLPEAKRSVAAAATFLRDANRTGAATSRSGTGSIPTSPSTSTSTSTPTPTPTPTPTSTSTSTSTSTPGSTHSDAGPAPPAPPIREPRAPSDSPAADAPAEHLDVVIVGAGLSGIGAAAHLQQRVPSKRFAILEARDAIGGTWDLFRYPGIRSDSDMHTLGYAFRPWTGADAIADGPSILRYIRETAAEHGLERHIRFGHRVVRADWSSADARWTLQVEAGGVRRRMTTGFLWMCSGYYSYSDPHRPAFGGEERFRGTLVHPQFWPEGLGTAGKRVVVIGSGATAVTLVPELAKTAAHVTMLQRSPSYVIALPARDRIDEWLKRRVSPMLAYRLVRFKNVLLGMLFFNAARRWPARVSARLIGDVRRRLGPGHDVDTHFTPRYDPWDQRLCVVPDADLFRAIRGGRASVVTDRIETLTEGGVRLASGRELAADVVVAATGLKLAMLGELEVRLDGVAWRPADALVYKGMMFSGVPNLFSTFGYTNASWTLKADLTAAYVCRLLRRMDRHGHAVVTPVRDASVEPRPFLDFSSGYVQRAQDNLPRQGSKRPWRLYQNYALDLVTLRFGRLDDGTLAFSGRTGR